MREKKHTREMDFGKKRKNIIPCTKGGGRGFSASKGGKKGGGWGSEGKRGEGKKR